MTADRDRPPESRTGIGHPEHLRVSAPANLLLMGEYAVLEEGGLGLACAPDVRATGSFVPAAPDQTDPRVRGVTRSRELHWPGDTGILGGVAAWLAATGASPRGTIVVDTSEFFQADGRKRGFGSSAAMTVVLTALWRRAAAYSPDSPDPDFSAPPHASSRDRTSESPHGQTLVQNAIAAHRAAQGGRGSGYDVAATTLGGFVRFRGGEHPQARRLELPWLPPFALVAGPDPVVTTGAVTRYRGWKNEHPDAARRFLDRSNELVSGFLAADSWERARPLLEQYRELTVALGDEIGVDARMGVGSSRTPVDAGGSEVARENESAMEGRGPAARSPEPEDAEPIVKALGAGNEIGIRIPAYEASIRIAPEGLRWE